MLSLIQPDRRSKQQEKQIKGGRESWGRESVNGKNIGWRFLREQERSHEDVAVGKFYHTTCGPQELRQGDAPSLKTKETKGTCLHYEKRCLY